MVGSTNGGVENTIDFSIKVSTPNLVVADYYETVSFHDNLINTQYLYKRPDVRVYALVFNTREITLREPVKRKRVQRLYRRLVNNSFNEAMFLSSIHSLPKTVEAMWSAVVELHAQVTALEKRYGSRPVWLLVSAGVPSVKMLEDCLENDIDEDLFRSMHPIDAVLAQA